MHDSKTRPTDGEINESRKDSNGHGSTKRKWTLQSQSSHDETTNNSKFIRISSSTSNRVVSHSSSNQEQKQNGDKKTNKDTKKPLRVVGDWSEFQSSKGKTYFYNCKTEVSQWEKPKGWPKDDSSSHRSNNTTQSSTEKFKKDSTVRSRHQVEDSPLVDRRISVKSNEQNGTIHRSDFNQKSVSTNEQTNHFHLPTPDDDSSRMSFSSTSSKDSISPNTNTSKINGANVQISSIPISTMNSNSPTNSTSINDNSSKISSNRTTTNGSTSTVSVESSINSTSKTEREQDIQKFYRADLISHLTDWPSTQLEKQCLKLFDDYHSYSAKIASTFTELKGLKSSLRVTEIKRNIFTQKISRCQQKEEKK